MQLKFSFDFDNKKCGKCVDCIRGAAMNFVREGPVTDVVRFQTLAILHKDHFDVTGQITTGYDVKYLLPVGIDKF